MEANGKEGIETGEEDLRRGEDDGTGLGEVKVLRFCSMFLGGIQGHKPKK